MRDEQAISKILDRLFESLACDFEPLDWDFENCHQSASQDATSPMTKPKTSRPVSGPEYPLGQLKTVTTRVRSDRPLLHMLPRISISDLKGWGLLQTGQTDCKDFDGYLMTRRCRRANGAED